MKKGDDDDRRKNNYSGDGGGKMPPPSSSSSSTTSPYPPRLVYTPAGGEEEDGGDDSATPRSQATAETSLEGEEEEDGSRDFYGDEDSPLPFHQQHLWPTGMRNRRRRRSPVETPLRQQTPPPRSQRQQPIGQSGEGAAVAALLPPSSSSSPTGPRRDRPEAAGVSSPGQLQQSGAIVQSSIKDVQQQQQQQQQQQGTLIQQPQAPIPRQQQQLLIIFCTTLCTSAAAFVYVVLPWTALLALLTGIASAAAVVRTAASIPDPQERVVAYVLRNRSLLPGWLHRALTETSLHDLLAPNEDFDWSRIIMENRHLLLYFMPLSADRLTQLLDALPERHARQLRRPGYLGRLLLGEEFWARNFAAPPAGATHPIPPVIVEHPHQRRHPATVSSSPGGQPHQQRLDLLDDMSIESDLGLSLSPNDMAGGLTDRQASQVAASLGLDVLGGSSAPAAIESAAPSVTEHHHERSSPDGGSAGSSMDEEEEYALEERLLTEAMSSALYAFWMPFFQTWRDWMADRIRPATRSLFRIGLGLIAGASGLGALGYHHRYQGTYLQVGNGHVSGVAGARSPSFNLLVTRVTAPRVVWTTAVLGMGTTAVAFLIRSFCWPRPPPAAYHHSRRPSMMSYNTSDQRSTRTAGTSKRSKPNK